MLTNCIFRLDAAQPVTENGRMSEVTESQVRLRLAEVADLIGRHEVALAYLKQERAELETAIRVFERFHGRPELSSGILPAVAAASVKPLAVPTVPEMIFEALRDAADRGREGLEPKEILAFIKERYWPDAQQTSVGPIAWRMWKKEGRLAKAGALYMLLKDETPAGDTTGASEPGPRSGGLFNHPPHDTGQTEGG
jgi:hypothetical protein